MTLTRYLYYNLIISRIYGLNSVSLYLILQLLRNMRDRKCKKEKHLTKNRSLGQTLLYLRKMKKQNDENVRSFNNETVPIALIYF